MYPGGRVRRPGPCGPAYWRPIAPELGIGPSWAPSTPRGEDAESAPGLPTGFTWQREPPQEGWWAQPACLHLRRAILVRVGGGHSCRVAELLYQGLLLPGPPDSHPPVRLLAGGSPLPLPGQRPGMLPTASRKGLASNPAFPTGPSSWALLSLGCPACLNQQTPRGRPGKKPRQSPQS